MADQFAVLLAVSLISYLVITGVWSYRSGSRFKKIAQTERTRTCWAEARNLLVVLMREKKLDPSSETFRTFYGVTTFVLRRPDEYEQIATALAKAFLVQTKGHERKWRHEMVQWPEEMVAVLGCINAGVGSLMTCHHGWRILAPFIVRAVGREWARRVIGLIPSIDTYLTVQQVQQRVGRLVQKTGRYQLTPPFGPELAPA